jgi:CRP-like cAMP-binding protein
MGLALAFPQTLRNDILSKLAVDDFNDLRPHLTRVRLVRGQVLIEPWHEVEHAFFVEDGMVSLIAESSANRAAMQVAMIGREGIVGGLSLLAPDALSAVTAVSQIPGHAVRVSVTSLRSLAAQRTAVRDLCFGYVHSLVQQTMQTAASNAQNTLSERCIRWLLMAHDRVDHDELRVTHEALATMLGVRRSGVTVVMSGLQEAGLVHANRGRITIADRAGLDRAAGQGNWSIGQRPATAFLGAAPAAALHQMATPAA